ncbi:MAG: glycoside hydrolase family 127 protein [Armatimonadetes bacterium]|nr:glycoside hydrolase family 127 protein [Armatimonadota bacterium]
MNRLYASNRAPLQDAAFDFLPLGSVKPRGWLKQQLTVQANGQTGHLPEFWDSLGPNSGWLGGTGESWERGPYYLDGLIPLAYLLDDEKLIGIARRFTEWTLGSQDESGHFGPKSLSDWWPFGVILKALTQYHEATGDPRVIPLMERFFKYMKRELPNNRMHSWAKVRWADTILSIIWLYNRNGDPELIELANDIMRQGYDWSWHFTDFGHTQKQALNFPMRTHVVNNGMAAKTPGVQYVLTGWQEHKDAVGKTIEMLDKFHGTAAGIFTGDEHYAGRNPTQGTELCAVVEYMFSLENLMQMFGDPAFGDQLEMIAYNALPGTFTADMWQHQYDQQANQVLCTIAKRHWTNNGDDANLFGLEPNYGCCTANFHQGWPKFAANLWMATPDEGLAAVAYGPCQVGAKVRGGQEISIDVETDYPWDETIKATLRLSKPAAFPLRFRIPAWAEEVSVHINGEADHAEPGTFLAIEREWQNGDVIELRLPMKVRVERRFNDSVTLRRGPIVYSLKIGERWEKIRGEDPCPDYAVHPTTAWNYGLLLDPEKPEVEVVKKSVGRTVYGPEFAPVELRVKGRKIPEWTLADNQAGPLPQSPAKSSEPAEDLTLIPYGCAKLRITEFPLLEG